jgi:Spy/CpxP family protein refolding chaperone
MIRVLMTLALLGLLVPLAPAQSDPPAEELPQAEFPSVAAKLRAQLSLEAEQADVFDALVDKYTAVEVEARRERMEYRQTIQTYREARMSGDDATAEAMMERLKTLKPVGAHVLRGFYNELNDVLTPEQQERVEAFRLETRDPTLGRELRMRMLIEKLPEHLDLTAEQREQYRALQAELRGTGARYRAQLNELRPLLEEMRAAKAAGNMERFEELRLEYNKLRPQPLTRTQFFDRVETLLTPEQLTRFYTLRGPLVPPGERLDVRRVLQAAQMLELNPEQRDQLREIRREAMRARSRERLDAEQQDALAREIRDRIRAFLEPGQRAEFESLLVRARHDRTQRERLDAGDDEPPEPEELTP